MTMAESVDEAVGAWRAATEAFCNLLPDGAVHNGVHGTHAFTSGVPVALLNGVFSISHQPSIAEVDELAASYSKTTRPWSIQIRGEASHAALAQIATRYGLTQSYPLPFMARRLEKGKLPAPVSGEATVRRISQDEHEAYNRVLAAGFEMPELIFAPLTIPEVIGAKGAGAYLVEEAGTPVATSFGLQIGTCVGVYNISTVPDYRLRGYARMATAAVLRDAYESGARTAFLQSTSAGYRVYESMGFETCETWLAFVAP
jgi:GNAT superfamily N-acetyltransferase